MADAPIPGGRIDWGAPAASSAPAPTGPTSAAPVPGGRIDWGNTSPTSSPASAKSGGGGFMSRVWHDVKAAPGAAVRGTIGTLIPGNLGKKVAADVNTGAAGMVHIPGAAAADLGTFAKSAVGQTGADVLFPAFAHLHTNENAQRQPGESLSAFTARKYPLLGGALVQGPVNTFEHAAHPTQLAADYAAHPVLGPLADAATLSLVTGPLARAAGAAAEGAGAGAEAATAAGDAAAAEQMAGRAATLGKVANVADVAHSTVENFANPLRPLLNGVGPVPGLRAIPEAAFSRAQDAAGTGDNVGRLTQVLSKLAKPMHAVSGAILEGNANEAAGMEAQTRLGKALTKIISDPEQQATAVTIGEKTAPALAAARQALGEEGFAKFVDDRYKGTLTLKAANLAADVVEGKAPEFAAKADEFLQTYADHAGGQADRTAAFMEDPGHAYQARYEPNPTAVQTAVDEAGKGLPKAQRLAAVARARADAAEQAATTAAKANTLPPLPASSAADHAAWVTSLEDRYPGVKLDIVDHPGTGSISVDRIVIPSDARNAGTGTAIMREVLDRADQQGKTVSLTPSSDFGGSKARLEQWYKGMGFKANKGRTADLAISDSMIRRPATTQAATPRLQTLASAAQAKAEGAAAAFDKGLSSTVDKQAAAERATGRLDTGVRQVAAGGEKIGAADMRAKVLGNLATSAEDRVSKLQTAAERAKATAEYSVENAPARLKPVLAENRAAAKAIVGSINDLRGRGLDESAKQVEDALANLPTDLKGLEAAGIDSQHFFHTQEIRPTKGGGAKGVSLPKPFEAGSEKLRTGSPVYDRTVAGQMKGGVEALRAEARRATVERINTLPGITARLGDGPLADVHNAEQAAAKGWVPWTPGTIFDTQGRVRPLGEVDAKLGLTGDTRFLPKPLFDEFRNYFEPRRGQVLGIVTDPLNRVSILSKLAFSPSFIVGRIFGHGTLAMMGTSDPVAFAGNMAQAVRDYLASGPKGERFFENAPPRLLKSNAAGAEYARLVNDVSKGEPRPGLLGKVGASRVGGVSGKLSELGNAAISKPFKLAAFFDEAQRTAFYMTELGKTGNPEAALESSLRATGEFDRMTPTERDYVRRIIPFWAWHRELTRIAFHLAEDHPLRVAWTLHLANLASQPDTSLPSQYAQGVKVGGNVADLNYLNPFNEVGGTTGGGLYGVGKILGPAAQLGIGQTFGLKPSTGRPFTRPAGTGKDNGKTPTAPSILHQFAGMIPQLKVLNSLNGRDDIKRYDTGQPVLSKGGATVPNPQAGTAKALTNFLGTPVASIKQQQAIKAASDAAAAKSLKTATKSQASYQKKLSKAGG